ncbi:hypothetical protein Tco_0857579 [Tanacetum coccineum]|uniref:Uncharacterized protein n=1 Tax=Tanacetum coccineum TaxID=301880 RepID=A0ABQ5B9D8_9ASTR
MTKVIKGEFEKIKDVKVKDVPFTYDTPLEVFNNEVNRLSGMDDDLFTYEVEVANIPGDSKMDDDSEQEADDDMEYDLSDVSSIEWLGSKNFNYKTMDHYILKALWIYRIRGDDEVKLTDEESSDDEDDIAEVFRIDTNIFDYEIPLCLAFKEFNYLLEINHEHNKSEELCEVHELPVCNIMRYMMIKCSFNDDEEYVVVKEDEYGDLTVTRKEACRAYQEIFQIMDVGWMLPRAFNDFWKLEVEYGVSTSIGYGVSSSLSNTTYSLKLINTAYLLPLDTAYLLPLDTTYRSSDKVIKREFEKIKDVKVEDVPLTYDTPLEVFNNEVSRLSEMDDDLFRYEVEVANISCDSKMDDDSK